MGTREIITLLQEAISDLQLEHVATRLFLDCYGMEALTNCFLLLLLLLLPFLNVVLIVGSFAMEARARSTKDGRGGKGKTNWQLLGKSSQVLIGFLFFLLTLLPLVSLCISLRTHVSRANCQARKNISDQDIKTSKKETIADLLKRLEAGLVPDDEIRSLIRVELERRLKWGYKSTHQEQLDQLLNLAHSIKKMKIASTEMDGLTSTLYEVPISFKQIHLGSHLKESCLCFKDETTTVDEAEIAMMDLYLERAQIKDEQSILDLGCGMGAVSFHIAQKYTSCNITAVTNSVRQKEFIEEKSKTLNVPNVKVLLADITTLEMEHTFDRLFAVGLIEHMENYELLLRKLSNWMKQDGLLFIDHLCHKTLAYHYEPMDEYDWYTNLLFPAGTLTLVSASFLLYFQDDLSVVNHWVMSGKHFSRANEEWLKNMDAKMDEMREISESIVESEEEVVKLINHWRMFCISSAEMFAYNDGEEWMNSHVLFKKKKQIQ